MTLRCPVCHSRYSADDLIQEGIKSDLIELAASFGRNWMLVIEYVDCFRTGQWNSVGEKKKVRILKEIKWLFERCEFKMDGKRFRTDKSAIVAAIRLVCDAEKYGFKNHNYLKRVLLGIKAEKLSASGETVQEEQQNIFDGQDGAKRLELDGETEKNYSASDFKKLHGITGSLRGM